MTLLAENPKTLRLLIALFADSQFLTDLFLQRPELIDTLIRIDLTRVEKTKSEMLRELRAVLGESHDIEDQLNVSGAIRPRNLFASACTIWAAVMN